MPEQDRIMTAAAALQALNFVSARAELAVEMEEDEASAVTTAQIADLLGVPNEVVNAAMMNSVDEGLATGDA